MEGSAIGDYKTVIRGLNISKREGQTFMVRRGPAITAAEFGKGKRVLEMGPGLGMLTRELEKTAKSVLSVEKDGRLFDLLQQESWSRKVKILNSDFFDCKEAEEGKFDIMISNIPYVLSSKVLLWLARRQMEAVLCVQREFADHMRARPGSRDYSKLSVVSWLTFGMEKIANVPASDFYPMPKVESALIHIVPNGRLLEGRTLDVISGVMSHKKKKLRNAVIDSSSQLGLGKERAAEIADGLEDKDQRPFKMEPKTILKDAERIRDALEHVG